MLFRASNTYDYYRPTPCRLRVTLRHRGVPEVERTPFDDLLARLGREHEKKHLATLPDVLDLSGLGPEERELETLKAIRSRAAAIYQGRFRCQLEIGGEACELVGEPDFLIWATAQDGFFIRESKLARRVEEGHH